MTTQISILNDLYDQIPAGTNKQKHTIDPINKFPCVVIGLNRDPDKRYFTTMNKSVANRFSYNFYMIIDRKKHRSWDEAFEEAENKAITVLTALSALKSIVWEDIILSPNNWDGKDVAIAFSVITVKNAQRRG